MMEYLKYLEHTPTIAVIAALVVVVKVFVRFIGNHMGEATKASQRLADMIERMLNFMERRMK